MEQWKRELREGVEGGCRVHDDRSTSRRSPFFRLTTLPDLSSRHLSYAKTRSMPQVTHMYSHGNPRNDHTVLHYGFLDRSRWEQPQVCCSDLDGADLWNCGVVDRNSRELGANKSTDCAWMMRRSDARPERRAPNKKKTMKKIVAVSPSSF